jgi:patatin-like phospholipase/acyl hydrolase
VQLLCKKLIQWVHFHVLDSYFSSHQDYLDGGIVMNNPALAALTHSLDKMKCGQQLQNVQVLSIGTGFTAHVSACTFRSKVPQENRA